MRGRPPARVAGVPLPMERPAPRRRAELDTPTRANESARRVTAPRRSRSPLRALAALAALVLLLGLPRVLIRCEAGGAVHVEFAHAPGACCAHQHGGEAHGHARGDRDGGEDAAPHAPCEHAELAIDLAPAPRDGAAGAVPPPHADGVVAAARPALRDARLVTRPPPATGPPRPDARARLRASTLLLL